MKSSDIHARLAALIAAKPELASFVPILVEDSTTDLRPVIDAALTARGVCIALADIPAAENNSASAGRRAQLTAGAAVLVYDLPNVAHSPAGLLLIEAVVEAVLADEDFGFVSWGRFEHGSGGQVALIDFNARVTIG